MNIESVNLLRKGLTAPNDEWQNFEDWLKENHGEYVENLSWNEYALRSKNYLNYTKGEKND